MKTTVQVAEWQTPFVDVFKHYNVLDGSGHDKKGNVGIFQDNNIGRRVFRIYGNISATNYVSFPPQKSNVPSLGLFGRYVYIEFLPTDELFVIHLDFTITKRNPVKFSISNLYESYKVTSSNALQIPFPKDVKNRWCILCLDVEQLLERYNLFPPNTFESFSRIYLLRSVQICSTLSIRGIYTSDNRYTPASLPREMDFKMPKAIWEDVYRFMYLPPELDEPKTAESAGRSKKSILKRTASKEERSSSKGAKSPGKQSSRKVETPKKASFHHEVQHEEHLVPVQHVEKIPEKPLIKPEERAKIPWYRPPTESVSHYTDQKSSVLELEHVIGFSGRRCPDVKWSKDPIKHDEVLYSSGKIVIGMNPETAEQRFFIGNTSSICCLDVSKDGSRVAAAQEDNEPYVKIYDFVTAKCVGTIPLKMKEVRSISFSFDRKLLSVTGADYHNRDMINIWDLQALETDHKPVLVAKQMSEFNILTCKFSPVETDKLVSCGRENIKFWRIKKDHLSGGAVVLSHHARDTVFTVLEYDFNHENPHTALTSDTAKRVFVGTKHGLLFQVNYLTRELEGVFKIHDSCICSLSVSAGFCVTGSEDQCLRVWPLDFSEYFLEAKHEGIVISLDISNDSLKVISGVSSGGLGLLELDNQSYRTINRAHTDRIRQIEFDEVDNTFTTLGEDLSIRVWDLNKFVQLYEFDYPKEDLCTYISCHPEGLFLAAGFQSGLLRIFNMEETKISEEYRFHNSPITCVRYSPNARHLITADQQATYNLFDVERGYQPIKVFEAEIGNDNPFACFSEDSATLATTGAYANHINIWDLYNFFRRGRIVVKGSTIKALKFSGDDLALFVLLSDGKIKMYGVRANEPIHLRDITPASKVTSNSLDVSANKQYVLAGCNDNRVRVFDIYNEPGDVKKVFPQDGHVQPVLSAIFSKDNKRVFSAGYEEGVYIWRFTGDLEPIDLPIDEDLESFSKMVPGNPHQVMTISKRIESEVDKLGSEIFIADTEEELKSPDEKGKRDTVRSQSVRSQSSPPVKDITNLERDHVLPSRGKVDQTEGDGERSEKTMTQSISPLESRTQAFLKSAKSPALRRGYKFKKFDPISRSRSPSPDGKKGKSTAKDAVKESMGATSTFRRKYVKSAIQKNNKLPFKHCALEGDSRLAEAKAKAILKTRNRLALDYVIGFNNTAHCNVVWNVPAGWFAYGYENYVIIEQLLSERTQKVLTFPEFVSCLALSPDTMYLAVGALTYNTDIYANINIVDCSTLQIIRTLKFHNKGIQSLVFSPDSRYLISVGNYRECTIGVWDPETGQLIASSYALTNINEVKVKPYVRHGVLEFVTVGADQIIQWIMDADSKLLSSETIIQPKHTKHVELTAFDYVLVNDRDYILLGTSEGEIMLFDLSSAELELRKKACNHEVIDIISNNNELKSVISSIDSKVYTWNYSESLKFDEDTNFTSLELKYPATCLYLDEKLNEGLIGSLDGGILYGNFKEDVFSKLVGAPSVENPIMRVKDLDENIFVTFHAFGSIKLWNAFNGEELAEYSYPKITCKDVLLHRSRSEIYCFYDDNSVKVVDLNNFEKITQYIIDEFMVQTDSEPRYINDSQFVQEQGQALPYYLCSTNKGEVYISELREKDEINWTEAFEQTHVGTIAYFDTHSKQRLFNLCFNDGTIQTYAFFRGTQVYPDIGLLDQWDLMDDPHGDLDKNEEAREATMTIYGTKVNRKYKITTAFTETRGIYFVITNYLQYVILRNSLTREILKRITLEEFPISLCYEISTKSIVVGLDKGWIVYYDFDGKEIQRQRNYNDGPVVHLRISSNEDQKKLIAVEEKGMTIYRSEK